MYDILSPVKFKSFKMFTGRLDKMFVTMKDKIITELSMVDHVCTTADVWSSAHKSFLGVTCHWIDPNSLERRSVALACDRMIGRHTYDAIAAKLSAVNGSYRIGRKITMTVTDNGSNFVKAFNEYACPVDSGETPNDSDDDLSYDDMSDILNAGEGGHDDDDDDTTTNYVLPPHQRCASHTLNLVATHDAGKALSNSAYKKLYRSTIAKCTALWNKASRSTNCADVVHEKLNTALIVPNDTRWNSHFRAIEKIKNILEKNSEDKIHDVFNALEVPLLLESEVDFVKEYCRVMQPLAFALDILQAENKCYIGFLLPTLASLEFKLSALKPSVKLTVPLIDAILEALKTRFAGYNERSELIIASMTLPQFKLRWLGEPKKADARSLLYQYATSIQVQQQQQQALQAIALTSSPHPVIENASDNVSQEDDFFCFTAQQAPQNTDAETQVDMFLTDTSTDIQSINRYPLIEMLFLKYNTALPSSAPVERLFSLGGQILTPRRNRLTPEHFERQLLLRANKWVLGSTNKPQ